MAYRICLDKPGFIEGTGMPVLAHAGGVMMAARIFSAKTRPMGAAGPPPFPQSLRARLRRAAADGRSP